MAVKSFFASLFPDQEADSIFDINYERFAHQGKKGLIFDLDNTLGAWQRDHLDEEVMNLLDEVRELDLKVGILSNGRGKNIRSLLEELPYPVIFNASKPRRQGYREMLKRLGLKPDEVVMIGDQLLTDILGANRMNMHSILVRPLDPGYEYQLIKLNRLLEWMLFSCRDLYFYLKRLSPGSRE
ncbi:MAG: YqeG family HAD IIIA-type phosphatase [Candidatus Acetothermia bacterium]